MCEPAPVALRLWYDVDARYGSRVTYLGIVGDQAHQARTSGHNCGLRQESPIDGVDYEDGYAHALDIKVNGDRALAMELVRLLLLDPRTRYVIFDGVGYYPEHRGGGTFESFDHEDHVHWSGMPGTTHDTRPFALGAGGDPDEEEIMAAKDEIQRDIRLGVQVTLGAVAKMLEAHDESLRAAMTRKHERTRRVIIETLTDAINDAAPGDARPIDVAAVLEAVDAKLDVATDDLADAAKAKITSIIAEAIAELPDAPE